MTKKQLPALEVAARLDVSVHSLYAWIKRYTKLQEQRVVLRILREDALRSMLHRGANTKQAERAGVRDASPQGRDTPWRGSIHRSLTPQAARHQRRLAQARGNPNAPQ